MTNTQTHQNQGAADIVKRYEIILGSRSNFESYWQVLHDYFYIEAPDINTQYSPGNELTIANLYDSTTLEAADVLASGFMNYLTPPTSKWFKLKAKDENLKHNKQVSDYLEDVTQEVLFAFQRSNFYDQAFPAYKSSGVMGTSLVFTEPDPLRSVRFTNIPLKQFCIVEDAFGQMSELFIEFSYSARQAAMRWGLDALPRERREEIIANQDNKTHKYILYVHNRSRRDIRSQTKENMPIAAIWVDSEAKQIIDISGYNEFPAMLHRFDKRPLIPWGFSPAMKTLPFARLLNTIAKTNLRAMMKRVDPPVALPDNAFLLPFNANPRAINYYNKKNMANQSDIFAFANYGDPAFGIQGVEYYSGKVKTLMYNDVFLAFDNIQKTMNNPEIAERINEKMTMLAPAVGRWISDVVNPAVTRTIGILFREGKLPEPPDELIQNPEYEIEILSQLAQAQKRSELTNLISAIGIVQNAAQVIPDAIDKINADKFVTEVWNITGANVQILRDDAEVDELRQNRAQQQAAVMEQQMQAQSATNNKLNAEAQKAAQEANTPAGIRA